MGRLPLSEQQQKRSRLKGEKEVGGENGRTGGRGNHGLNEKINKYKTLKKHIQYMIYNKY